MVGLKHLAHFFIVIPLFLWQIWLLLNSLLNILVFLELEELIYLKWVCLSSLNWNIGLHIWWWWESSEHFKHILTIVVNIMTEIARKHWGEPWLPLDDLLVNCSQSICIFGLLLLFDVKWVLLFLGFLWYAQNSWVFSLISVIKLILLLIVLVDSWWRVSILSVFYDYLYSGFGFDLLFDYWSFPQLKSALILSENRGTRDTHAHKWFLKWLFIIVSYCYLLRALSVMLFVFSWDRERHVHFIHLIDIVLGHFELRVIYMLDTRVWAISSETFEDTTCS